MTYKNYISYLATSMNLLASYYNELKEKEYSNLNNEMNDESLAKYNALNYVIRNITYDIQEDLECNLRSK